MIRTAKYMVGFTLIEVVIVIVLTGILGVVATSFFTPLQGYFGALDRAELSDVADTALRRMARELRAALPNSVRVSVSGSDSYIEFLPTTTGGRYRKVRDCSEEQDCSEHGVGDTLDFVTTDFSFDVIGKLSSSPVAGEELVVYNTAPDSAYAGVNVVTLTATAGADCALSTTQICFNDGIQFLFESPNGRFQIISEPVTFACVGNTLWRHSGYARQPVQPTDRTQAPLSSPTTSIAKLATNVDCSKTRFIYDPGVNRRASLVTMQLTLVIKDSSGENIDRVTLLHQVHVQNVP